MGLDEGLAQGLHDLEIVAAGWPNGDPQGDRAHREVIAGRQNADDGENAGQHNEHHAPPRGEAGGRRCRRRVGTACH